MDPIVQVILAFCFVVGCVCAKIVDNAKDAAKKQKEKEDNTIPGDDNMIPEIVFLCLPRKKENE